MRFAASRLSRLGTGAWMLATVLTLYLGLSVSGPAPVAAQDEGGTSVLKIGWGQDPTSLNPFVGLDEEAYTIWALIWDQMVNFDPETLEPVPGIAESWEVSEDGKTVTFKLADRVWSDGEPITSADVKYSLKTLGEEGDLFAGYTTNVTSVETPDEETVVIETSQPDARVIGGLFIYMLPEHIWGKQSIDDLTGSYKPELPIVGSGPYVVTEYERGRILTLDVNPNWEGEEPGFDEIQFIKYGTEDAVERALQLGEIDADLEVQNTTFDRLGTEPNIETFRSASPAYTELAFNLCPADLCPDAEFNPAIQEQAVRQAIGWAVDRTKINQITTLGTSFIANGILPDYYKAFYEVPELDYNPPDLDLADQLLDEAGWIENGEEPRTKDDMELSFNLYVRAEAQQDIQAAKLVSEMTRPLGIEMSVEVVSVGKLTELTVQKVDGKPAPAFDSFIWGWGGDPYDPSFLLGLLTTEEIGGSSDAFYSNPEYDRLFNEQAGEFDTELRKQLIEQMVAITQEDLPYLVLTYDPNLQAYRSDRIANVEPTCPAGETGDLLCEAVSYEPLLSLAPAEGGGAATVDDGSSLVLVGLALLIGAGGGYLVGRRGRRDNEPLELDG